MDEKLLHVGLDVGSTTVKIVIMDNNLNTIYTNYRRHFSDTKNTVCDVLEELARDYSEYKFTIALTGSGAMSAAFSPASTGGGLIMAAYMTASNSENKEEEQNKLFGTLFVIALACVALNVLFSFLGVYKLGYALFG